MATKLKTVKKVYVGTNLVYDKGDAAVDFLLVGGGGSSGSGNPTSCIPGGGGGGGVIQCFDYALQNGTYGVNIGAGGCQNGNLARNGGDSSFDGIVAYGGGGGGSGYSSATYSAGCSGGSGGGGSGTYVCSNHFSCGGVGCSGQGNAGGKGYNYNGYGGGGGGGGAGGPGCDAGYGGPGAGGPGIYSDISGICLAYGGGGAGGFNSCAYYCDICRACCQGGVGGGGGLNSGGHAYYYGGGGGGYQSYCGIGCQGIFILRYPTECGYNISGGCKYIYGSNTVHCFTSSGFLTVGDIVPKGVYTNTSLGLITLSDGNGGQMTIADKNLGATTVWNWNDTVTAANSGCFYQRGNNYGFPFCGSLTCSCIQVNASSYGPGNYYCNYIFRNNNENWDSSCNNNLWGGETGTVEARQGPTPSGFHVPSKQDWVLLNCLGCCAGFWSANDSCFGGLLHLTKTGYISYGGSYSSQSYGYYRTTDKYDNGATRAWNLFSSCGTARTEYMLPKAYGMAIRPFKNEVAIPDDSWTKVV